MRPKKTKTLIPVVAKKLNLSENLVECVMQYYWEQIRKSLSCLSHQRIHLVNLGDFYIKHWKLEQKITSLENWEESNKQKGLQQITARYKTAENLYELRAIKKNMMEESQRKDFITMHKNNNNELTDKHN